MLHSFRVRVRRLLLVAVLTGSATALAVDPPPEPALWRLYRQSLAKAKYVDLTHTVSPSTPVWPGIPATAATSSLAPSWTAPGSSWRAFIREAVHSRATGETRTR